MALNKTQSMFVNSLKKAAPSAHKKSRDTEVQVQGGGLPEGIARGVAQFTDYKLGEISKGKAKGKKYMSLKSTVVEPSQYRGLSAVKNIYFRETKNKSIADQIVAFNNELKKLGADLSGTTEDDWFEILDVLKDEGPYHYFHTWKGEATPQYPNPQVNTEFDGVMGLEDYSDPSSVNDGVEDNTEVEEEDEDDSLPFDEAEDGDDEEEYEEVEEEYEEDDEEGDLVPSKGDTFDYQPPRAKEPSPCVVTAVFLSSQKVNLRRVDDDKAFKGVPWEKLLS